MFARGLVDNLRQVFGRDAEAVGIELNVVMLRVMDLHQLEKELIDAVLVRAAGERIPRHYIAMKK